MNIAKIFNRMFSIFVKWILTTIPINSIKMIDGRVSQALGWGYGNSALSTELEIALSLVKPLEKRKLLIYDIGANEGNWSRLLFQKTGYEVHCFEPSNKTYQKLLRLYSSDPNFKLVKLALSDQIGVTTLYSDSSGSSLSSLSKRKLDFLGKTFDEEESVNSSTLQAYILESGKCPDLIKVDVEGHELAVLRGAGELLTSISVIQFEFGGCNIDSRTYFRDFWDLLNGKGFRISRQTSRGLIPITEYNESLEKFITCNYFAVNSLRI